MKETTKMKLVKIAKIAGMALTAFFAVLGLVFSAAALNMCSGGEDRRTPIVTLSERKSKGELNEGNERFFDEVYEGVYVTSTTDTSIQFGKRGSWQVVSLEVTESVYIVSSESWYYFWGVSESSEITHLDNVLAQAESMTSGTITCPELTTLDFYTRQASVYLLEPVEGTKYYIAGYIDTFFGGLRIVDLMNDPPIMSVNWGFQWFPWQMMGYAGSNPVILSSIAGSLDDQHLIEHRYLDGFYFRSNGKLYKKIDIVYTWANGSELTDGSGKFYTVSNNNAWIIQEVRYYYGDGGQDFDRVANFSLFESPTNSYNIPAYGPLAWVSPAFRQIDIVFIVDDNALITTNTGSYTLSQWIEILLQPMSGDVTINVIQGGDPFTLMTTAFDSMKGILSIAVLPGISLGLLLFLPIIAGIIVIILRVVKR